MQDSAVLLWFRQDLRLADNPAIQAALKLKQPVIPLYIDSSDSSSPYGRLGAASRWWLHHSLEKLDDELQKRGSRLVIRQGDPRQILPELIAENKVDHVCWNRCYEPQAVARDTALKKHLTDLNVLVSSHNGSLLAEPWEIQTKTGSPYQVFTPFSRAVKAHPIPAPGSTPRAIPASPEFPSSLSLEELRFLPRIPWDKEFYDSWQPGEAGARQELKRFLKQSVRDYKTKRDLPALPGTSRLSPHLHFGEISPRQIWHEVCSSVAEDPAQPEFGEPYLRQLIWRDFAHHLLYHFPQTVTKPLRADFEHFPWHEDSQALHAWQRGRTGFPIVDAGMRELWRTGWMHNRVRMIVASFLVKDLLIPWQAGADWFWDTLVDADLANNTLGWQWVAGCGADAAPYFRIFNPITQGKKFDPEGAYIRRWVPELASLPDQFIHAPWEAPKEVLAPAGIQLGSTYPRPLVDHAAARAAALEALKTMNRSTRE